MESSLNSTRCLPSSSSSSSSSSKAVLVTPVLIPPNAAFPPASENGEEATAVPNTLAFFGAPKAAKSVTTLRGGEPGDEKAELVGDEAILEGGDRGGVAGVYDEV